MTENIHKLNCEAEYEDGDGYRHNSNNHINSYSKAHKDIVIYNQVLKIKRV